VSRLTGPDASERISALTIEAVGFAPKSSDQPVIVTIA
jgi:hypothetical protein